jgi:hypothetical protein
MRRLVLSILLLLTCACITSARQISGNQALIRAKAYCADYSGSPLLKAVSSKLSLAYTAKSSIAGDNCFYVYNRGNSDGFIIVSADDVAAPVLGYSDSGSFNSASLPQNVSWWLGEYARQIDYAISHNLQQYPTISASDADTLAVSVNPLLGNIRWDQGHPYNDMCPVLSGTHCATGCVATAMAQIMYYHKWPIMGNGSYSYTTLTNHFKLSANFGSTVYHWSAMTPSYSSNSDSKADACTAVATLMLHCGISVKMDYDASSGAFGEDIAPAFANYFNYDKGIAHYYHKYYSDSTWNGIIRNELYNSRPVLYCGVTSSNEGHAFVCDGCDAGDGYFHINWGWSGYYNGNFLLNALDPEGQGTGGAASGNGFDYYQEIVVGIQKPTNSSSSVINIIADSISYLDRHISRDQSVTLGLNGIWNASIDTADVDIAFALLDKSDSIVGTSLCYSSPMLSGAGYDYLETSFSIPENLTPGTYHMYPCFRIKGASKWDRIAIDENQPKLIRVDASADSAHVYLYRPVISVKSITHQPDTLLSRQVSIIKAVIANSGAPYAGSVYYSISSVGSDNLEFKSSSQNVSLPDGGSATLTFSESFSIFDGSYVIRMYDAKTDNVIPGCIDTVTIAGLSRPAVLSLASPISFTNNSNVPRNKMELTASISNTGGPYNGIIIPLVYDSPLGTKKIGSIRQDTLYIPKDSTVIATFKGSLPKGVVGKKYIVKLYDATGKKWLEPSDNAFLTFTLGADVSGINSPMITKGSVYPNPADGVVYINSPEAIEKIEIYSSTGALVLSQPFSGVNDAELDVSSLSKGYYMVRISTTASGTLIEKLLKR